MQSEAGGRVSSLLRLTEKATQVLRSHFSVSSGPKSWDTLTGNSRNTLTSKSFFQRTSATLYQLACNDYIYIISICALIDARTRCIMQNSKHSRSCKRTKPNLIWRSLSFYVTIALSVLHPEKLYLNYASYYFDAHNTRGHMFPSDAFIYNPWCTVMLSVSLCSLSFPSDAPNLRKMKTSMC